MEGATANTPTGEKLQNQRATKSMAHQATQRVSFRMDQPISVGDGIESQPLPPKSDGPLQPASKEFTVDLFGRIVGQDAQSDARVTIVESSADPLAVSVKDVHDGAGGKPSRRLVHHLLENPR